MKKSTAIEYFGTQTAIAKAIGLTKSAISQWGELIPLDKALLIQAATAGNLPVDMADYGFPSLTVRPQRRSQRREVAQ